MSFEKQYIRMLILAMISSIFNTANLPGQIQKNRADYDFLKRSDAWLASDNAAGLDNFVLQKASVAEMNYKKSNGRFINYYESDNSFEYGALCESYFRLNSKTVVYGKMEYSSFSGKNMGGSSSIDPYYNPLNIVEYADSTAGTKLKKNYHLIGALSTILTNRLTLGLKVDYTTMSYDKIKDLRHTNDLMDLSVTAGLRYNRFQWLNIGANYFYRRSSEGVSFETAGKKDQQFNSLIDFGAFYGHQERFGQSGYTYDTNLFFNQFNGLGLQLQFFPAGKLTFFNDLSVKFRSGYFGVKSSITPVYTEHSSTIGAYTGVVALKGPTSLQQISLHLEIEQLENFENAFRKEATAGGNINFVYYSKNRVLDHNRTEASVGYTGNFGIKDKNPMWVVDALVSAKMNREKVALYPSYRKQEINQYLSEVSAKRNFYLPKGVVRVNLQLGYGFGSGYAASDGLSGTPGTSQSAAVTLDKYLYREYDYLTAKKVTGMVAARYTASLTGVKAILYGEIGYERTHAFAVSHVGDTFGSVLLKVGCLF